MHKRAAKHNEVSSDVTASTRCDARKELHGCVTKCRKNTRKRTDVRQSGEMYF